MPAVVTSTTSLTCVAPAHDLYGGPTFKQWHGDRRDGPGDVEVQVSMNGVDYSTLTLRTFEYVPSASVTSVWPTSGPERGDTDVVLSVGGSSLSARAGSRSTRHLSAPDPGSKQTTSPASGPGFLAFSWGFFEIS